MIDLDRFERELRRPCSRLRHLRVAGEVAMVRIGLALLTVGCHVGWHRWEDVPAPESGVQQCIHCLRVREVAP